MVIAPTHASLIVVGMVAAFAGAGVIALIARQKGRDLWLWWSYAMLLPPVALLHVLLLPSRYCRCAHWREQSRARAETCWNCGRHLAGNTAPGLSGQVSLSGR